VRHIKRLGLRAVVVIALAATLALAACGGDDEVGGGSDEEVSVVEKGPVEGSITISNWPLYIDKGDQGTIAEFEQASGVDTTYIEDVNDNNEFFGKLRPEFEQGKSGGRSIAVVTDWMAKRMYDLGYLQEFDLADLPDVEANLRDDLREPDFDPERKYSVPWQSGMTGVIVRKDLAPDITSVNDLFDPKYKGKVTMLTELRDTVPLVMKADGVDPNGASKEDWLAAIDKIREAAESGQIRDFTGNDYADDLTRGDVVAAIGWSGDAIQLQADNPDIEWRMPDEGCILWSDNMVIPVGAPNPSAALEFMDFVYDPEVQADVAEYVNYVTPVDGVKEILAERDPELANNQLIFPDDEFTESCSIQPTLEGSDEQEIEEAFQQVITG
jgi:spermidine/putrescine transport system substrate-binding protein